MIEKIEECFPENKILKVQGFDKAIIGYSEKLNLTINLIYSVSKCLEILEQNMDEFEAIEYFTFNISGSYFGENNPIWCWDNL